MVAVKDLLDEIEEKKAKILELRDKIGGLAETLKDTYLNFAVLLGLEIGKQHKIDPEELDIRIMLNGKIIVQAGKGFRLEFDNYNKQLEYLLCMVRLTSLEDGSAVAHGRKSQAQVYFESDECKEQETKKEKQFFCKSCGKVLPPIDEDDDPSLADICEKCYHDGEY